ncbi:MAG: SDR family oxidoreductase [Hyphomicrobiaceae bacterium]
MTASAADARLCVITGGASGIGRTAAELLLARGWKVALIDLPGKTLDEATDAFASNTAVRVDACNVTDEAAVEKLLAAVEASHGPIAGVVNSAGIAADIHTLDTPVDLFRKILDVNVIGSFIVARAAARLMAKHQHGAIVNIASISGLRGSKGRVAYGTSKGAVITMTQVLANDLAKYGIRVNAIAPGPVETPMVKALHTDADRKLWRTFVPMRRYAQPEEIASAIAFLVDGTQSGYITGEVIAVDGGFRGAGIILPEGA